jgi:hypothetical protein
MKNNFRGSSFEKKKFGKRGAMYTQKINETQRDSFPFDIIWIFVELNSNHFEMETQLWNRLWLLFRVFGWESRVFSTAYRFCVASTGINSVG